MANVGLVLSGGGARAAYQVGAIRALCEIESAKTLPFRIVTGLSAGALNAATLASGADDFSRATALLEKLWRGLTPDRVYHTNITRLTSIGMRWIKDVTMGGLLGSARVNFLLDTAPLRKLLEENLQLGRIRDHIESRLLRGVAVSATSYETGNTVTFFDGVPSIELWERPNRVACRSEIRLEHVMASAAIPIFFPPIEIEGHFYGDGGVRIVAPIGPAVHLGAEKILTIGIRHSRAPVHLSPRPSPGPEGRITVSQIAGVLMNALFLDSLDNDLARIERINRTLSVIPPEARARLKDPLRRIPTLALSPSQDLGKLAADQYQRFPKMLRHLLRGIGATANTGWDLISYLAFEPTYVGKLIELGYRDTMARRIEIEAFLGTDIQDSAPPSLYPGAR